MLGCKDISTRTSASQPIQTHKAWQKDQRRAVAPSIWHRWRKPLRRLERCSICFDATIPQNFDARSAPGVPEASRPGKSGVTQAHQTLSDTGSHDLPNWMSHIPDNTVLSR